MIILAHSVVGIVAFVLLVAWLGVMTDADGPLEALRNAFVMALALAFVGLLIWSFCAVADYWFPAYVVKAVTK